MAITRRELIQSAAVGTAALAVGGVIGKVAFTEVAEEGEQAASGLTGQAQEVANARKLSPDDVTRAVKTFVPPGNQHGDEFFLISSGGHSGQVFVMGVPSLRLLKTIGVFTPEPWQGHGYGADSSDAVLAAGTANPSGNGPLTWGDTHHPALSETNGEYDGRFAYINDRANGRIAMIDLRDFKTKQILDVPNLQSSHGGVFVTQNTEYVHIATKTPTLVDMSKADGALDRFADAFRGYSTFLAIDKNGRFDVARSFQVELPPYTQDLSDSGKLVSHGWVFLNSYNSEMSSGGNMEGKPAIETGASKGDYDYLHIINWKKAEQLVAAGRTKNVNGMRVISLDVAAAEGVLFLAPEPRSPHGVDVSPNGAYMVVSGKLDPHVTVYGFDKLMKAVDAKDFESRDRYGVPILRYDSVVTAQVEVGAGPLHTQFDEFGHGFTSLFVESAVAKWSLGEPYFKGDAGFKLVDKIPVQYNIGHLVTMEGDTVKPQGKFLVSLNKWSIDRFPTVGTLKPQNFQLVDLSGPKMNLLSDTPIGMGEPHYVQAIRADRIKAWEVYPPGTNPLTMERDANAIALGGERVVRRGNTVEVWGTVKRSNFKPDNIFVNKGDRLILHLTNTETTPDATHGFSIPRYNINTSIDPGEVVNLDFIAEEPGAFALYCTEFCSALHLEMQGWLMVNA
jgi:nitrous-oxide reductase